MRVNDPNPTEVASGALGGPGTQKIQEAARPARGGAAGRSGAALGESPDRVALSELSGRLRDLTLDAPERAARLEKLGVEVGAGRYQVEALELSRRLIEQALVPRSEKARP